LLIIQFGLLKIAAMLEKSDELATFLLSIQAPDDIAGNPDKMGKNF